MKNLIIQLINDENGFIVSAELILVGTIAVLAMVVGLSEVAQAVNQELEDVASAFGSANQTYSYAGLDSKKAEWAGSRFRDAADYCDGQYDLVATAPQPEGGHNNNGGYGGEGGYGY